MDPQGILMALGVGEDRDWEFKSARGGLPGSLWETYSAMANTDGGYIVLGVQPHGGSHTVVGMDDPAQVRRDFWNTINNRGKVSANLLRDEDVVEREAEGKRLVVIHVPRATRHERPVYIGQNPLLGTFRRNYEGDYRCTEKDDTPVHEALREAVVNALIHADYRGQGGIVIEKYKNRFEISNPGTLLLPLEQVLRGGLSECRNKTLQTMFMLMGRGEKAGSGIDTIWRGWKSQQWRLPRIEERTCPDRVILTLPMISLLPEESLRRLQGRFGKELERLGPQEVQALVTADVEGDVSNARMQEVSPLHPADITRLLQGLARRDFLVQSGRKRSTVYRLSSKGTGVRRDSPQIGVDSPRKIGESLHKPPPAEESQWLKMVAAPARERRRLPAKETQDIILRLCEGRYLTAIELGDLMGRHPRGLSDRFLSGMVRKGLLVRRYPNEPNRPDQAYTTAARDMTTP